METKNEGNKATRPEQTGKVPASGVMSETYKEEVNAQDKLGSSSKDPNDPEESDRSTEDDFGSYPLEEGDFSEEKSTEKMPEEDSTDEKDENEVPPRVKKDDMFLK